MPYSQNQINEIVENLNFSLENLEKFLFFKFSGFNFEKQKFLFDKEKIFENVKEITKLGDVKIDVTNNFCVFAIEYERELNERASKKKQFEIAKRLLKNGFYDAGFFVFFDQNGNFRFSLVYSIPKGTKKEYSFYKRYTYYVEKGKPYRTVKKALTEMKTETLEDIISAFSVVPLTEEFYQEIQNWYAWAIKESMNNRVWFPGGKIEDNLIRLLTRLIFVWFLKQMDLVPHEIFNESDLRRIIKDFGSSNYYYNCMLQNLFFATLNRYPNDRAFAEDEGFVYNRNNFGIKTLYRYEKFLLITKDEFIRIFERVPFINGGLFECLDDDNDYIDGFSRNENKRAKIDDSLFFSAERKEDLSEFYGEKRVEKVRGLINILKDYSWTVDESSPIDVEVSLDPELLGNIFENLLAVYNPETNTTARKVTGSYYTPKEIVDFMVREVVCQYLSYRTNISQDLLHKVLSYDEDEIVLSKEDRLEIVKAVDELKVLDPAVGSGAFPMGIVRALVHLLNRVDPDKEMWYDLQLNRALEEIEKLKEENEEVDKDELITEINRSFDDSVAYPDYARKLYVIENCIYGVDIQPIAIQICKLRFFLSLLVESKVNFLDSNFGIKPLPHLETKFVTANTLVGIDKGKLIPVEAKKLIDKLKDIYKRFFRIRTRTEKKRLEDAVNLLRQQIKDILVKYKWNYFVAEKIANFDIFSQTASADWFDSEWMFGISDGFDIVIGNPPYGDIAGKHLNALQKTKEYIKNNYNYSTDSEIASPFIERGIDLLRKGGFLYYIITFAITFRKDFSGNRCQLNKNFEKVKIFVFDRDKCRIFQNMSQSVALLFAINKCSDRKDGIYTSRMFRKMPDLYSIEVSKCDKKYLIPTGVDFCSYQKYPHRLPKLGEKINVQILEKLLNYPDKVRSILNPKDSNKEKVWIRTSGNYWYNAWDRKPYTGFDIRDVLIKKDYKYFFILLMNSSLFYWWFRIYGDGRHMNIDILEEFPLPMYEKIQSNQILLEKVSNWFMEKLFSVFDEQKHRFNTSEIKGEIDLLDYILCINIYGLDYQEWLHIANYDFEVRNGLKFNDSLFQLLQNFYKK